MGKNKKYKRLAKRMLGECIVKGSCVDCIYFNHIDGLDVRVCAIKPPINLGVRKVERICKYGR